MRRQLSLWFAAASLWGVPVLAQTAPHLPFVGRLSDAGGAPINAAAVTFTVRFFSVSEGGVALWQQAYEVQVAGGAFAIDIGAETGAVPPTPEDRGDPVGPELFAGPTWLEVQVASDPPFVPRLALGASARALRASVSEELECVDCVATAELVDDAASDAKVSDAISISNGLLHAPAGGAGVGIGTDTPQAGLHVYEGDVLIEAATGNRYLTFDSPSTVNIASLIRVTRDGLPRIIYGSPGNGGADDFVIFAYDNTGTFLGNRFYVGRTNGNVGIGNAAPTERLDVVGGNGRVETGYNWLTTSDRRLKENITTLEGALPAVLALRGVRYDVRGRDPNPAGRGRNLGFIAQELEAVLPELVVTDTAGTKAVAYANLTPVLVEAIKAQQAQITALEARLAALEGRASPATAGVPWWGVGVLVVVVAAGAFRRREPVRNY